MPPLKHVLRQNRLWLLAVFLLLCLPWLFIGGPAWLDTELARGLMNLGHAPLFFLLGYGLSLLVPWPEPRKTLFTLAVLFALGIGVEYLQTFVGRSASWGDIARNMTGAGMAVFWFRPANRWVWAGRAITTGIFCLQIAAFAQLALLEYRIWRQSPIIANLEPSWSLKQWSGNGPISRSQEYVSEGQYSLRSVLPASPFPGAEIQKPPADWNGYDRLLFDLYNPHDQALALGIRIHDHQHRGWFSDRFNKRLTASPGWNHYAIALEEIEKGPEERKLDLTTIQMVKIFAIRPEQERVIYLDNFRLSTQ